MTPSFRPQARFALLCSEKSLEDMELSALNRASHLRKQLIATFDELVRMEAEAVFARWMREHRNEMLLLVQPDERQKTLGFIEEGSA